MNTAEVLVFAGGELGYRTLSYAVPDALAGQVQVGSGVVVPLQSRQVLGVVLSLREQATPDESLKPLWAVLNQPLLSGVLLHLSEWLARTQLCSPAEAVQSVLPPFARYHLQTVYALREPVPTLRSRNAQRVAETLKALGGRASLGALQKRIASAILRPGLDYLRQRGALETFHELAPPPIPVQETRWVEVVADSEALEEFFASQAHRAPAQTRLLTQLLLHPEGRLQEQELRQATGVSTQVLRALEARGLIRRVRTALSGEEVSNLTPPAPRSASEEVSNLTPPAASREGETYLTPSPLSASREGETYLTPSPSPHAERGVHHEPHPVMLSDSEASQHLTPPAASREGGESRHDSPSPFTERGSGGEVYPTNGSESTDAPEPTTHASPSPFTERGSGGEVYPTHALESTDAPELKTHASPSPFTERGSGGEVKSLTPAQADAVQALRQAIQQGGYQPFLLFGVTGSGKTEVYLRASAEVLRTGRTVLFLVPEIALTAQLSQRFRERFGESVAVLHSQLSPTERYAQWLRIHRGEAPIVVGARSALFAPLRNVGLIVVDEEHEPSYKQTSSPAYHARRLAEIRARQEGALLLLGSATPSIETFYRAEVGELHRLELPERVGGLPLPTIELIDLRGGRFQVITQPLLDAIHETVRSGRQVILFLNRRGFSPILLCRECGHVPMCPNCSVALTYHRGAQNHLRCHHCGHQEGAPGQCPSCGGIQLLPFGIGTQRVEATLREMAGDLRIARLDRDTLGGREGYLQILQQFRAGELDVLIGTQMIARGLDFPRVGLVGVISADTGLHVPDFRAGERTFHLLMQVAGRAGRSGQPGRALVQTYNPDHPAIAHALQHDYLGFYRMELATREPLRYPPFCRLVNLISQHTNPLEAEGVLNRLAERLAEQLDNPLMQILGPTAAPLERVAGRYRYHLLLKYAPDSEPADLLGGLLSTLDPRERAMLTVDIDPLQLL